MTIAFPGEPNAPGFLPLIPPRSTREVPEQPDHRRSLDDNRVESIFGKLNQQRRIATHYDKTVLPFKSFHNLATALFWMKFFVNAA